MGKPLSQYYMGIGNFNLSPNLTWLDEMMEGCQGCIPTNGIRIILNILVSIIIIDLENSWCLGSQYYILNLKEALKEQRLEKSH